MSVPVVIDDDCCCEEMAGFCEVHSRDPERTELVELPWPERELPGGGLVFAGGVEALGNMVVVPGRSLTVDRFAELRQHAAAILAACDLVEQACAVQACAGFPQLG